MTNNDMFEITHPIDMDWKKYILLQKELDEAVELLKEVYNDPNYEVICVPNLDIFLKRLEDGKGGRGGR